MELRWYWRVLRRQWRIVWISFVVVAILAAAYTAYNFTNSRYKAQTTIEFSQLPPSYNTQNIPGDPVGAAQGNASAARDNAKEFTQRIGFFQAVSAWLKVHDQQNIDWKVIRSVLGANTTGGRYLEVEYTSSNPGKAIQIVTAATAIVRRDFLPHYNQTELITSAHSNVIEPPIQMYIFDAPNAPSTSLTSTLVGWFVKALLGLVLGVALAFLWEYLDESIHDEQDVRNWMSTPTLGVIPGGK